MSCYRIGLGFERRGAATFRDSLLQLAHDRLEVQYADKSSLDDPKQRDDVIYQLSKDDKDCHPSTPVHSPRIPLPPKQNVLPTALSTIYVFIIFLDSVYNLTGCEWVLCVSEKACGNDGVPIMFLDFEISGARPIDAFN
eukprot:6476936-Amphidinium_carterae.1